MELADLFAVLVTMLISISRHDESFKKMKQQAQSHDFHCTMYNVHEELYVNSYNFVLFGTHI